jgi:hypothetical protein
MVAAVSRCFCGCRRRVLVRGRVANLYGRNAAKLAAEMGAFVEMAQKETLRLSPDLGWGAQQVADIRDGLNERASTYAEVVHREKKLKDVDRLDYVEYRDRAAALLSDYRHWLSENPEQLRTAALGKWAEDSGLSDEELATRLASTHPADLEKILAEHERRAAP